MDCADCSDCEVVDPSQDGYDFTNFPGDCVCYVGPLLYGFQGSNGDDCIAITGDFTSGDYFNVRGGDGDDMIAVPGAGAAESVDLMGGTGDDICPVWADCELSY